MTMDRGFAIVAAYQVSGSRFCSTMSRDACNNVTSDKDSITVASIPSNVLKIEPGIEPDKVLV